MLSAAIAPGFIAFFVFRYLGLPRTDVVKIKPQIVVLSDSEEDNHEGGDAPCHTEYSKTCSEYTVQQMMPQLNFYFLVYGFRCNELQRSNLWVTDIFFSFHC